jgi:ribosomal subunit interface protein
VSSHLDIITHKYFDDALDAHVTFSKARSFFTCDINLHAGRGLTVRGEGEAADARAAFEDAAEHIAARLRRYRKRVSEHARTTGARAKPQNAKQYVLAPEAEETAEPVANGHTPTLEETLHATVVAESATAIETLSVRDAVMRLDLAFTTVLMFRNAKTDQLNVIYRRPDGNVGWIDPSA